MRNGFGLVVVLIALVLAGQLRAALPPVEPVSAEELEGAIQRGIDYLLRDQNPTGSWGSPQHTKGLNVYAPVPGAHHAFRTAVTAMCISALAESGMTETNERVRASLDRGEAWLLVHLPELRRANPTAIYNVWGHCYGIEALVHMSRRETKETARQERIHAAILGQIDLLRRYESVDGGWGYYDFDVGAKRPAASSTSFVTAAVLVALHRAQEIGIQVPADIVERAVASINRQRKKDHSYMYGEYLKMRPMRGINRPGGSLGRSQACNVSLRFWGDETITDAVLTDWLDRLVTRNGWLSIGRKRPVPHESWFQVAGYFYYFGHYYAALCIEELGSGQEMYKDQLARLLLPLQEKDGTWWDFPLYNYHQQYGTAFAVMSLVRCRK